MLDRLLSRPVASQDSIDDAEELGSIDDVVNGEIG